MGAEEEEVAKMGCPSLGDHTRLEVVIEESYEFKVTITNIKEIPGYVKAFGRIPSVFSHVIPQQAIQLSSCRE